MGMLEERYRQQKNVLVVKFNGWLFEGYEDAKTVLMTSIVDAIISKRKLTEKGKYFAVKLFKKVDLMKLGGSVLKYGAGLLMGPGGLAAVSVADTIGKLKEVNYSDYVDAKGKEGEDDKTESIKESIQEFHSSFEGLVAETKLKKIIVFIDDLDRCSPDTVIGTLEAIKLFLFTKSTAFVIGADERLIRYAVRRRFPEIPGGDNQDVGRDYLEKLIQYPIRIPPLNSVELANYVNLLFSQLHIDTGEFGIVLPKVMEDKQKAGFDFLFDAAAAAKYFHTVGEPLKEGLQLSAQVAPILSAGLNGNPRQCKRFLNALLLRVNMAAAKGISLDKRVLAKLMLLEYFMPETFGLFHKEQAANKGMIPFMGVLEEAAKDPQSEEGKAAKDQLTPGALGFLDDRWLVNWFKSAPSLDKVDLQVYYYVSRDRLADGGISLQRMSSAAHEFFSKMAGQGNAAWANALAKVATLSHGDAAAIFEGAAQRIREVGESDDDKTMARLLDFVKARAEHTSQLIAFLDALPVKNIKIAVVTHLAALTSGTPYAPAARKLVEKWSVNAENKSLAAISSKKINDIK